MILKRNQMSALPFGKKEILPYSYSSSRKQLTPVAQTVLSSRVRPGHTGHSNTPEMVALQLLDYLSSKKNYIRRKGKTFRSEALYTRMLPPFTRAISRGEPIKLSSICMCTALCNPDLVGNSPYPHMASYLGFENLHKILRGAKEIYDPGFIVILGYEGNLLKPMFFHNDMVIETTLRILQELNDKAFSVVMPRETRNPVRFIDAEWMVEKTFGSKAAFDKQVAARLEVQYASMEDWLAWYDRSTSPTYFASDSHKQEFALQIAKWRHAVRALKLEGGKFNGGFAQFDTESIPFTMSGRRQDIIGLQLIPENPYMPHHRSIAYHPKENKWRMKAHLALQNDSKKYVPRLVGDYTHPFYYEEVD